METKSEIKGGEKYIRVVISNTYLDCNSLEKGKHGCDILPADE